MECNDGIRSLGVTNVPVKLHQDVKATLKVHVMKSGATTMNESMMDRVPPHNTEAEASVCAIFP